MPETETLPATDDPAALVALRPRLILDASGHGLHAMATNAPRYLSVHWEDLGFTSGWSWQTRRGGDCDSGSLDSVAELDELLLWVDAEPRAAAS